MTTPASFRTRRRRRRARASARENAPRATKARRDGRRFDTAPRSPHGIATDSCGVLAMTTLTSFRTRRRRRRARASARENAVPAAPAAAAPPTNDEGQARWPSLRHRAVFRSRDRHGLLRSPRDDDSPRRQDGHQRTGWDSNPRYPCGYTGFRDRLLQPLGHLSRRTPKGFHAKSTGMPTGFPPGEPVGSHGGTLSRTPVLAILGPGSRRPPPGPPWPRNRSLLLKVRRVPRRDDDKPDR